MTDQQWYDYKVNFSKELKFQARWLLKYLEEQFGKNKLTELAKQEVMYSVDRVERVMYSMPDFKTAD